MIYFDLLYLSFPGSLGGYIVCQHYKSLFVLAYICRIFDILPYYRKLTLHEIKVLEINAT